MDKFKLNTIKSFKNAKKDIVELQNAVKILNDNQKWLIKKVIELQHGKEEQISKKLVASKESNKVHADNCPFAKNIKNESKQSFENLKQANLYGYEACGCIA